MKRQHVDKYVADMEDIFRARFAKAADNPKIKRVFLGFNERLARLTLPPPARKIGDLVAKKKVVTLPPIKVPKRRKDKPPPPPRPARKTPRPSRPG